MKSGLRCIQLSLMSVRCRQQMRVMRLLLGPPTPRPAPPNPPFSPLHHPFPPSPPSQFCISSRLRASMQAQYTAISLQFTRPHITTRNNQHHQNENKPLCKPHLSLTLPPPPPPLRRFHLPLHVSQNKVPSTRQWHISRQAAMGA